MPEENMDLIFTALEKVLKTGPENAFTMPGEFYTSESLLELEREQLFSARWICVGRAEEIPQIGDYFTTQLTDEPVIIIRQPNHQIKALSNVCRHRAMPLVEGTGNTRAFTCSYHAWTYDLDGKLMHAQGLEDHHTNFIRDCRLPEFKCELWHGFIFINLDSSAESLIESDSIKQLEPYVRNMHMEDMCLIYSNVQEWDANWKCLVENFMEGYHLSVVHRKTLHPYTPTRLCQHITGNDSYFGYLAGYPEGAVSRGMPQTDLSDEEMKRSLMLCISPASVFGITGFKVTYNLIQPVSATRLRTKIGMLGIAPDSEQARQKLEAGVDLFTRTFSEDEVQLRKIMRGLKSKYYRQSVLAKADYEGTIWDFHNYIAKNLKPTD